MATAGLNSRAVEVIYEGHDEKGPFWEVGSGSFVCPNLVLTASHCIPPGPGKLRVRLLYDRREYPAVVRLQADKDKVDLAVLEVSDVTVEVPALRYGEVDRNVSGTVKECRAIGFPWFKRMNDKPGAPRFSAQVDGEIPTGENYGQPILTLQITNKDPRPLPNDKSEWAGISGAVVFSSNDIIIGVLTEHHLPEGERALAVVPITAIDDLLPSAEAVKWWQLLGVDRRALVCLPDPVSGSSQTLSSIRFRLDTASTSDIPQPLVYEFHERLITIGRARKNMIVLPEADVSWEHGQIVLQEGQYVYCHLSSSSRTILRRKGLEQIFRPSKKEELPLRNQDRLTIGKTTFIVELDLVNEDTGYKTTAVTAENQNEPG